MVYAKFYQLSTGYVEGTIPPVYKEEAKKPIEKLGSDSYTRLDARLTNANLKIKAAEIARQRNAIGFDIRIGTISKYHTVIPYTEVK
jgi:hypothetical protein